MNITIKPNTYVEPTQARPEFVQKICDIFVCHLSRNTAIRVMMNDEFPTLFLSRDNDEIIHYGDKDKKIRTCEMRLAFRLLQQAGYYIFYKEDVRDEKYIVTKREYIGTTRATYTDFIHHID